jgi:hypothetical protein
MSEEGEQMDVSYETQNGEQPMDDEHTLIMRQSAELLMSHMEPALSEHKKPRRFGKSAYAYFVTFVVKMHEISMKVARESKGESKYMDVYRMEMKRLVDEEMCRIDEEGIEKRIAKIGVSTIVQPW